MTIPNQDPVRSCGKCHAGKPLTEFYLRTNGKPHRECKVCYRARIAVHRDKDRAHIRSIDLKAQAKKRAKVREAVFAAYGGYVCACCGETERKFLTLDHINNDGAADRIKIAGKRSAAGFPTYSFLVRKGFPSGYQVLCMNCNYGKRMNNGVCPHRVRCNDYPLTE